MKYIKGFFYCVLLIITLFSCLVALGSLLLLLKDYVSYKQLGQNVTDTLYITGLCAMNAGVCGVVAGLFKV